MTQAKMARLEEVATFIGGSTPSRANQAHFGGTIPWVKTTDLNNGLITRTEETLTEPGLANSSCKIVPKEAVLVAMYGGFNQIGRTGLLAMPSAINQALTAVLPDREQLNPNYLLEWLNFRVGYWKRFAGSSRKDPNITKGDVADYGLLLPFVGTHETDAAQAAQHAAMAAQAIWRIFQRNKVVGYWDNLDAQRRTMNEIDDYLYDEVKGGLGVGLTTAEMDQIIEQVMELARHRMAG